MVEDLVSVPPDITVERLITDYLFHTSLREFLVRRDEDLLGTVSLDQLAAVDQGARSRMTVEEVMTPISEDIKISPENVLSDALRKMNENHFNRLLVIENGKLVGIVTKNGVLRLLELKSS
jgi:predicted transcriptional regulator